MNRCPEMTDELASKLNLIRATTELGTYTRRQKSSPDAILDYFLSSKKLKQETMFNLNLDLSDHKPIKCVLKFESDDDSFFSNISHKDMLRKGTTTQDLLYICMHPDFPNEPFMTVAK